MVFLDNDLGIAIISVLLVIVHER